MKTEKNLSIVWDGEDWLLKNWDHVIKKCTSKENAEKLLEMFKK